MSTKDLESSLFKILSDYGDFFLTDYPNQSAAKSVHPTLRRIMQAIREHERRKGGYG